MDDETKKLVQERFAVLPPDVQQAVRDANLPLKIQNIARRHLLHLDKVADLEAEVILVMLGAEPPTDFIRNIKANVGLTGEEARAIANEVNDFIFKPIRASLRGMHGIGEVLNDTVVISDNFEKPNTPYTTPLFPSSTDKNKVALEKQVQSPSPATISSIIQTALKPSNQANFGSTVVEKALPTPTRLPTLANQNTLNFLKPSALGQVPVALPPTPPAPLDLVEHKLQSVTTGGKVGEKKELQMDPYREPLQ